MLLSSDVLFLAVPDAHLRQVEYKRRPVAFSGLNSCSSNKGQRMSLIQPQAALFEPDSETICVTDHTTEAWASFTCVCGDVLIMCKKNNQFHR